MSKLSESLSKKIEKEVPVIVSSKTVCPVSESTTCIFLFSKEANLQRSTLLVACGYIEESQLFLNFNSSLENRKIQVVDSETGQTVFDDTITGTSFYFLRRN